ncbi:MAG: S-layer homology domain-containing protein, partial [Anaerotignum faecicola]
GSDGLKVVTLDLGGGTLGGSAKDIQIIVKNGESFTAPASDGLTRPDGNTENYFKWLGSDGNLYAPGESVSADVTKLTAKFAGGSSGSGGGGGSRKPSVTYYTLHFETNGGSAITDMREENNTRISLTKYVPTRHGYTFIGWYSDHNLTNQVSEVSLTKNMTVYAGWRADENPDIVVNPFTDVSKKDWFYNDAMFVYKNGLMLGTSKTLFSPHGTVTRGMMATILWRMEGSLAPKGENSFTDVEAGMWYTDAITWTAENGIFAGYSKEKFGPDDPITREQLTAIFYRYADYKGYKLTVTGNLDKFEDADKITDYAKTVMQWAVGNGLIKGKAENLLDPQGTATRAEIAAMLHRFVENTKPTQMD